LASSASSHSIFILLQLHVDFDGGVALKNPLRGIAAVTEILLHASQTRNGP